MGLMKSLLGCSIRFFFSPRDFGLRFKSRLVNTKPAVRDSKPRVFRREKQTHSAQCRYASCVIAKELGRASEKNI